jgi:hypothetical protein
MTFTTGIKKLKAAWKIIASAGKINSENQKSLCQNINSGYFFLYRILNQSDHF